MSNPEPFQTPDGPEDLMVECEGCKNFLYVRQQEGLKVAPCPICGCLNKTEITPDELLNGRLVLKSPRMDMSRNSLEEGRVSLPDLPKKVQEALLWLQEHQWNFGFVIDEESEESEEK